MFNLKNDIESWDRRECVKFCLFCCNKVKHMMNKESLKAVKLVEKWLEYKTSISKEELERAADAAYVAYITHHAAAKAAYYTANAAYYVNCYASKTAYYTANAAHYASNVAYCASKAINSSKETLYLEYMRGELSNIMEG